VSGEAIRARRIALEMTQRHFAERTGLALSFVKYVEGGQSQPSDVNAQRMARVLQCDATDFSTPKPADTIASGSAA
jgi:transcriptional regulator with XRE-family HTH domain